MTHTKICELQQEMLSCWLQKINFATLLYCKALCHLQQILSVISQSTEIGQVDQQLTAEDLGKGVVGLNYLLKQRESVNFT